MAGPCETLSFVTRRLIQFESRFAKADLARRRAASRLFAHIGATLQGLAADLSRDTLPHEPCRELVFFATKLAGAVSEEIGMQEAEKLSATLSQASDEEKLFLEFRASERREELKEELEKAAILIQALANGIYMELPEEAEAGDSAAPGRAA